KKFGPEFASERIPTLREVIHAARDQIKLNIELKFYGRDYRLARKVADLVEEEDLADQCFLASLNYGGDVGVKKAKPRVRPAHAATASLSDISQGDVDILSINVSLAKDDRLLRKAQRLGKEVHVWGVKDRQTIRAMMERGVNNIITDYPERVIELRQERE